MNESIKGLIILEMVTNINPSKKNHCFARPGADSTIDPINNSINGSTINHNEYTYDMIVDLLIKGQKIRYQYPQMDIGCRVDPKVLEDEDTYKILSGTYDKIIPSSDALDRAQINAIRKSNHYNIVKKYDTTCIGLDDSLFDDDYEYNQIKTTLGPLASKHFMFMERDLEIQLREGFDFNKNKIRFQNKKADPKMKIVSEMYGIEPSFVKHFHLKYYHTIKKSQYRPFNINQMFDHIESFDYETPLKKLSEYHSKDSYYQKLYEKYSKQLIAARESRTRLNLVDAIQPDDRDLIALQYIKCRKSCFVITVWKPALSGLDRLVELLESNGSIYYIKTLQLNKNGLRNLLFWYYDEFNFDERLIFVEKKLTYIEATDENNPVCVILFDNINNKALSGRGSPFKQVIRDNLMKYANLDKNKYYVNDLLHVNDYFYQTVEYCQLFLIKNSLTVLNNQDCRVFATDTFIPHNLRLQTFRRIIYSDMSLLEIDRMMTSGGTVFYAYGLRGSTDIDTLLIDIEPNTSNKLVTFVDNFFSNKKTKFFFLDAGIQGSRYWRDTWTQKNKLILDFLKIRDLKELVLDPKNYFYFQGIKMSSLDFEMARKLLRNKTGDHVDFMMLSLIGPDTMNPYISLNNDGSKIPMGKYFMIDPSYKDFIGEYNDRPHQVKVPILVRRYSSEQIERFSNLQVFKDFFGTIDEIEQLSDRKTSNSDEANKNI